MNIYHKFSLSLILLIAMIGAAHAQQDARVKLATSLPAAQTAARQWVSFGPYNEALNGKEQAPSAVKESKIARLAPVSNYPEPIQSISDIGFWSYATGQSVENEVMAWEKDAYVTVLLPDLSYTGVSPEALRLVGWDGKEWHCLGNTGASGVTAGSRLNGIINTAAIQKIGIGSISKALPIQAQVVLLASSPCAGMSYGTVVTPTGKTWLDRNLGSPRVAIAYYDFVAYGSLFQWGRLADGHECINWTNFTAGTPINGTTLTQSGSDDPGHSLFIAINPSIPTNNRDWRNPPNNSLWQGIGGGNNPCPTGFRLPTQAEWSAEAAFFPSGNGYSTALKLPMSPLRLPGGAISGGNTSGAYWSSTISLAQNSAYTMSITSTGTSGMFLGFKQTARAVRCIQN